MPYKESCISGGGWIGLSYRNTSWVPGVCTWNVHSMKHLALASPELSCLCGSASAELVSQASVTQGASNIQQASGEIPWGQQSGQLIKWNGEEKRVEWGKGRLGEEERAAWVVSIWSLMVAKLWAEQVMEEGGAVLRRESKVAKRLKETLSWCVLGSCGSMAK